MGSRSFFDLALALDRQIAFVWQSRGLFFCAEGALNSAIADFHFALSLDPLSDTARVNIGYACDTRGDHRETIRFYNEALEINSRSIEALANRGAACAALSDYQDALRDYDAALTISGRAAWIHFNKGQALAAVGQYEQAFNAFQLATGGDPTSSLFWYARGLAAAVTHDGPQARTCWTRAIARATESDAGIIKRANGLLEWNSSIEPLSMLCQALSELLPLWRPAQPRLSPTLPMAYRPPANHKRGSGFDDSALLGHDNIVKQVCHRTLRGNARCTPLTSDRRIQDRDLAPSIRTMGFPRSIIIVVGLMHPQDATGGNGGGGLPKKGVRVPQRERVPCAIPCPEHSTAPPLGRVARWDASEVAAATNLRLQSREATSGFGGSRR